MSPFGAVHCQSLVQEPALQAAAAETMLTSFGIWLSINAFWGQMCGPKNGSVFGIIFGFCIDFDKQPAKQN